MISHVCLSDLHLGAPNSLLSQVPDGATDVEPTTASRPLEAVVACLDDLVSSVNGPGVPPPTLILNGDILELALADDDEAVATFDQFVRLAFVERRLFADRIVYLPGNHDHHLWETSREEAYATHVRGVPAGERPATPWHATKLFAEGEPGSASRGFGSSLLDAVLHRHPGLDDVHVEMRYPSLGLRDDDTGRVVAIHHGHFVEQVYLLMSWIRETGFPGSRPPRTMPEMEAENFAWIDFWWSSLGRSAAVGHDVSLMYNMSQDREAMVTMAGNFSTALADQLPRWMPFRRLLARTLFQVATGHFHGLERSRAVAPGDHDPHGRLQRLLEGPLAAELGDELGSPVETDVTFVYGHTHKPYGQRVAARGFRSPVAVLNTGGWVVDDVTPERGLGAAAVLLDDRLRAVRLDLFRQSRSNGALPARFASPDRDDAPFLAELGAAVDLSGGPWPALPRILEETMHARQRTVRRIIEAGIQQARRPPWRG